LALQNCGLVATAQWRDRNMTSRIRLSQRRNGGPVAGATRDSARALA